MATCSKWKKYLCHMKTSQICSKYICHFVTLALMILRSICVSKLETLIGNHDTWYIYHGYIVYGIYITVRSELLNFCGLNPVYIVP